MMLPPANQPPPQVVDSIGESDNECFVKYADAVVNVIRRDAEPLRSARARRYSTAPTVQRTCESCGLSFLALASDVRRGRGVRFCSRSCHSRANALRRHAATHQRGERNPNWRGGRSSRPYDSYVKHFKSANPEKARAHQIVAAAIRSGRLIRPAACSECSRSCRAEAHHEDYSRPLVVRWLCKGCHRRADLARIKHRPSSGL